MGKFYKKEKNQKKLKKSLDKVEETWYNSQAAEKKGSERSLKIEQQEISTKQKQVRKY